MANGNGLTAASGTVCSKDQNPRENPRENPVIWGFAGTAAALHQPAPVLAYFSAENPVLVEPEASDFTFSAPFLLISSFRLIRLPFSPTGRYASPRSGPSQGPETGCVRFCARNHPIGERIRMARVDGCYCQPLSVTAVYSPRGN
jgi:hypothetical protein